MDITDILTSEETPPDFDEVESLELLFKSGPQYTIR